MVILNSAVLTAFGSYTYLPIDLDTARKLVQRQAFTSAVGHQATADILTTLLGVEVPMNRIQYEQAQYETAIIFKLKARAPEGVVLSAEEIEQIGYEFGILYREIEHHSVEKH